jgi:recombination protein RecT
LAGKTVHFEENDPTYGELALVCPDGEAVHPLDWRTDQPVPLLKNVLRLTAPNPGMMTGPGTNSYLVGEPGTGYIVIDPGPNEPAHVERLWRAAGGDIRMIVCTHSHADHAPGARPLQALCRAAGQNHRLPPVLGLPSAPTARPASDFTPDRTLQNQEHLTLVSQEAVTGHTLKVIHTPGHAANHLCLVLLEDGLLFSGDHILNGSTTVIDPPDGDMTDYLDSLDALSAACDEHSIDFILPAHGHVLGRASHAIAHLKAHRLKREAKIRQVMQAHPDGTLDDWVVHAYDDVHQRLWPLAKRSLLAHVQRLRESD